MPTPDFLAEALQRLGLSDVPIETMTDEQFDLVLMLEADLRAEDGWAKLDWEDANPGWIGL